MFALLRLSVFLVFIVTSLAACTNKEVYESVRSNRLNDCQYLTEPERERCMERYDKTYDEYEREREAILKEDE